MVNQNPGYTEALGEHASNPPTSRSSGHPLIALGETWTVSSCELRIMAQFEQWVRANAMRVIRDLEMGEDCSQADADRMRSSYIGDLAAGHYNWDGKYCRNARADVPGATQLLYLLIRRCHPKVDIRKVEDIFNDNVKGSALAIGWAMGNSRSPARTRKPGRTALEEDNEELRATSEETRRKQEGTIVQGTLIDPITMDSP